MFPATFRHNRDSRIRAGTGHLEIVDLGAEVGNVVTPLQCRGQGRLDKIHQNALALLAQIDACRSVRQVDDDLCFAVPASPEIDVAYRVSFANSLGFCKSSRRVGRRCHRPAFQGNDHCVSLDLRVVLNHLGEVEYHPGPAARLPEPDRAQIALVNILRIFSETIRGAGKIERNPRRVVDGKCRRGVGRHILESELDCDGTRLR